MNAETQTAGETASEARTVRAVTVADVRREVEAINARSAWMRGVTAQALDMLGEMAEWADFDTKNKPGKDLADGIIRCASKAELVDKLKNGAGSWSDASIGGSALCYDEDIALRYCTASELKRTKGGTLPPNSRETWLDVQARAMYQAAVMIANAWWGLANA